MVHRAAGMKTTMFAVLALSAFGACAETPAPGNSTGPGGGKADSELTTLEFDADWNETATGALVAGQTIAIEYDLARVTECRGQTNGSEVWGVGGYASFDGGEPVLFAVSRIADGVVVPVTAELDIPAGATGVELWFETSNRWGCHAYDSNENANYEFAIEQGASTIVAAFEADYSESVSGAIRTGDQLVVHYDPARLEECASSQGGRPQWSITGYYQVDGGAVKQLLVTRADGSELVAADPEITVPRGSELALWFESTSVHGCHAYDSDNGANYQLDIE